jgi:hypothetical protein
MPDVNYLDPAIVSAIAESQKATMSPDVIAAGGAGKAYQDVAAAAAIAVQDATDMLRNVSTIAATAMGTALAELIATGDPKAGQALTAAQATINRAAADYTQICTAAATLLKEFPRS